MGDGEGGLISVKRWGVFLVLLVASAVLWAQYVAPSVSVLLSAVVFLMFGAVVMGVVIRFVE